MSTDTQQTMDKMEYVKELALTAIDVGNDLVRLAKEHVRKSSDNLNHAAGIILLRDLLATKGYINRSNTGDAQRIKGRQLFYQEKIIGHRPLCVIWEERAWLEAHLQRLETSREKIDLLTDGQLRETAKFFHHLAQIANNTHTLG